MVFKRKIFEDLVNSQKSKKISLIFGPRQVGKTHLMKRLAKQTKNYKYFNLEFPADSRIFNQDADELFCLLTNSEPYIFIDEFHYVENISQIFKAIYDWGDLHPKKSIKIFASGSSAIEMHKHLKESLAGRFKKFIVRPLSLEEYKSNTKIETSLNQYLKFGGLPGTYNASENPSDSDKQEYLQNLVATYIQKDIKSLIIEENISGFNNLIYLLACWQGQIISSTSLARETRVTEKTIERYLDILEQTFTIHKLKSFSKNLSNELKKSKKYFFYDLGIRNSIANDFNIQKNKGMIWETFTYHHLILFQKANNAIYFWRTSDQTEIDFIWMDGSVPTPIEVKSDLHAPEIPKAFKTFFRAYPSAPMGIVMNEKINTTVDFLGKPVHFISFQNIEKIVELVNITG